LYAHIIGKYGKSVKREEVKMGRGRMEKGREKQGKIKCKVRHGKVKRICRW